MSQVKGNQEFTSEFFEQSSQVWMENKLRKGASLMYKCEALCKNGTKCIRGAILKDGLQEKRCAQHKQRVPE